MHDATPTAAAIPAPADAPRTVEFACPCVKCGYDLFGLRVNARCPECGTRVRASHQGPTLDQRAPAWVRTIALGQRQLAWSSLSWTLAFTLFCAFAVALLFQGVDDWRQLSTIAVLTVGPCLVAGLVLLVAGGMRVTVREPGCDIAPPQRAACRALLWIAMTIGGAMALLAIARPLSATSTPASLAIFDGMIIAIGVVGVLLVVQGSAHLARLAIRLPDPELARRMIRCANATALVAALGAGMSAVTSLDIFGLGFGVPRWSTPRDRVVIVVAGLIVVGFLSCLSWWTVLMQRLASRLRYSQPRD